MTYKLIKELGKSGKMQVTPEQSEALQKALFEMGYRWITGEEISHFTDYISVCLYWDDKRITWASFDIHGDNPLHLFDNHFETINH